MFWGAIERYLPEETARERVREAEGTEHHLVCGCWILEFEMRFSKDSRTFLAVGPTMPAPSPKLYDFKPLSHANHTSPAE